MTTSERKSHYPQETFTHSQKGKWAHSIMMRFMQHGVVSDSVASICASAANPKLDPTQLIVGDERFRLDFHSIFRQNSEGAVVTSIIFDLDKPPSDNDVDGAKLRLFTEYTRDPKKGNISYGSGNVCIYSYGGVDSEPSPFPERHNNLKTIRRIERAFKSLLPPVSTRAPAA